MQTSYRTAIKQVLGPQKSQWLSWVLRNGLEYRSLYDYTSVQGWLTPGEAKLLYDLGRSLRSERGTIVEIGSWLGQSAVIFGRAVTGFQGAAVYCIDPFESQDVSHSDDMKQTAFAVEGSRNDGLLGTFHDNIQRAGVAERIRVMRGYSYDFAPSWNTPIDVLFIDGNHAYEAAKQDYLEWHRHIVPGGYLVMHDVELPASRAKHHPGPGRVVEEFLLGNPDFEDGRLVDFMYCTRRTSSPPQTTASSRLSA